MGGWGQALGQTFGQVGNDTSEASQANTDRQLNIALQKIQQQMLQQQIAASQQQMKIAGAPQTTYLPTPQGGTVAAQASPLGGPVTTQPVVPDRPVPHSLTDESIAAASKQLPPNVPPELFTAVVTGLRDMGQYDKALEFMGKQGTARPAIREVLEPDPNSSTGWSKVAYDAVGGGELSRQLNVAPQRGLIGSQSTTTDALGNTSTTVRKPILGGTATPASPTAPRPISTAPPKLSRDPAATPLNPNPKPDSPRAAVSQATARFSPSQTGGTLPLDADGHIPSSVRANPQIVEAANQLLDGKDIDKLPMKARLQAGELARKYGWEQGKFTPKEQVMLREATSILQQLKSSKALAVLDQGTATRLKLVAALSSPDKHGLLGSAVVATMSQGLTGPEAEYVRLYNQAVGRISGLSQLVRSGRATEAQIERLKSELPNPMSTRDSSDARKRLELILGEVGIALQKGNFEQAARQELGVGNAPPAQSAAPAMSPAAQQYMQKHGITGGAQ